MTVTAAASQSRRRDPGKSWWEYWVLQ